MGKHLVRYCARCSLVGQQELCFVMLGKAGNSWWCRPSCRLKQWWRSSWWWVRPWWRVTDQPVPSRACRVCCVCLFDHICNQSHTDGSDKSCWLMDETSHTCFLLWGHTITLQRGSTACSSTHGSTFMVCLGALVNPAIYIPKVKSRITFDYQSASSPQEACTGFPHVLVMNLTSVHNMKKH